MYARIPGNIRDGSTGDVACDSYNRYDQDIKNMQMLGVHQYRFSISWSRIFPTGLMSEGINQEGVDYYNRLLDALNSSGVVAQVTLYHWDLPQSLQDRGGWLNRDVVQWFADYADFCYKTFGDRVRKWITLNEPHSQVTDGYCGDTHENAPGGFQAHCAWTLYLSGHYMLLAHAKAYEIYNTQYKPTQNGICGITINTDFYEPMNATSPSDLDAADRDFQFFFGWFANPIFSPLGDYPTVMKDRIGNLSKAENRSISRLPAFTPDELNAVKGSADFLGLNYYTSHTSRLLTTADETPKGQKQRDAGTMGGWMTGAPVIGPPDSWIHAYPDGLRKILNYVKTNFNNTPTIITENGCMDSPGEDLDDQTRIFYLAGHISAVAKAISEDKVNVIGYTVWSIMDNFEWADGFSTKFGIYRTNFSDPNLTRIPKASAYWFANVTRNNFVDEIPLPPIASTTIIPSSPSTTAGGTTTTAGGATTTASSSTTAGGTTTTAGGATTTASGPTTAGGATTTASGTTIAATSDPTADTNMTTAKAEMTMTTTNDSRRLNANLLSHFDAILVIVLCKILWF